MVENGSPRPHLRHTGTGWCAKCQTDCLLLDDYEKYGRDPYDLLDPSDYGDEADDY